MKNILFKLFCIATGLAIANLSWAHGGGGGGGGGAGGGGGGGGGSGGGAGAAGGGNGNGGGGGNGHGGGMGHGDGHGFGHAGTGDTVSSHGTHSQNPGNKGATHHGRALSAHSRSSNLTTAHHAHAHHHLVHSSKGAQHVALNERQPGRRIETFTPDLDTRKALPPGIELNVDRGKAVPPGIESQLGPITPDVDTAAERALPPGIELNADRGKTVPPGIITPDKDVEHAETPSEGGDAGHQ